MSINTKKQFQKCLPTYDENAVVQKDMGDKIIKLLTKYCTKFDNILELGCGTGILTKKVTQNFDIKNYWANDFVEDVQKMLPQNIEFILGDINEIEFPQNIDLVISNAVFQWFVNPEIVINKIAKVLNHDDYFIFSTFSPRNFYEIKSLCGLSLEYKTEKDLVKILSKEFKIVEIMSYEKILNFSSPIEVLKHMKKTGVNSLDTKPWGITKTREFCKKYSQKFPKNTLTYCPIIIVVKK